MRSIIRAVIVASLLAIMGCTQKTPNVEEDGSAKLKELVIQHLTDDSGHIRDTPHFVIETFDRRTRTIAVTGIFRSLGEHENRIGRFWVELQRTESTWKPETIAIRSTSDSNAEQLRWP